MWRCNTTPKDMAKTMSLTKEEINVDIAVKKQTQGEDILDKERKMERSDKLICIYVHNIIIQRCPQCEGEYSPETKKIVVEKWCYFPEL